MSVKQESQESKEASARQQGVLKWDDYFMALAFLTARRSKDPSTQVGACIVNKDKRVVGLGYNGMPNGFKDEDSHWKRNEEYELKDKPSYVCHAAMNAIVNKNSATLQDCTLYEVLLPCNECAKLIIQSGIKEVVYYIDIPKYNTEVSKAIFECAGVKCREHKPAEPITIDFSEIDRKQ